MVERRTAGKEGRQGWAGALGKASQKPGAWPYTACAEAQGGEEAMFDVLGCEQLGKVTVANN